MKEEIRRIMRLVQEGKLSAEDAAELIDAFSNSDMNEPHDSASSTGTQTPPPPPGDAQNREANRDPFKQFVETMEGLGRDVASSVDWQEVARSIRDGARKGAEGIRQGIDQIRSGHMNFPWTNAKANREICLPLNLSSGKTLRVENYSGDVCITGGFEVAEVTASATILGTDREDAEAKAEDFNLVIEESDHEVLVRLPDTSSLNVDLDVRIPSSAPVQVSVESGSLNLIDLNAGARIQMRDGDLKVRNVNGPIEIRQNSGDIVVDGSHTSTLRVEGKSGDISLKNINGVINVRNAHGDIVLKECAGSTIALESVNGDISADLTEPIHGQISIRTVHGDSNVLIPDGSNCRVTLSTLRGDVSCGMPLDDESRSENRISGRFGEGHGSLDISAVTGDINVGQREHAVT